jgi:hypothetical protein
MEITQVSNDAEDEKDVRNKSREKARIGLTVVQMISCEEG